MRLIRLLPLLALTPIFAADPEGFAVWKASDLKTYEKTLAPKVNAQKLFNQSLGNYGNHTTAIVHREGNGEMEVHANWNDLMIIQTGEATMLIGGTVLNPRTTGPGEIRGNGATGGEKKAIAPGDIIHVPANVPHQILIAPGTQLTYFAVKIPAK